MTYSIVISSYKYGHLAAHCIETILNQSRKFDKIFFVDDGVGDCTGFDARYPEIEFVFRQENLGTVANFQDMLNRVTSDYCMFIGADNWLRSDALQELSKCAEEQNVDIVTYDMILTGELKETRVRHHRGEVSSFQGDYYWSRENKHHGSMLYRTCLAKSVGGYARNDERSSQTLEDLNLWNKMIDAGAKVSHVNQGFLYYRHHKQNYNRY